MIKILIVEDEPGIYTFLQERLTDEGYDTLVATDAVTHCVTLLTGGPTWCCSTGC